MRLAILDDYQGIALHSADWSAVERRVDISVFRSHLGDVDAAATALRGFEILIAMRERTPFPRQLLERLPGLRLLVTTGMRNLAIDTVADMQVLFDQIPRNIFRGSARTFASVPLARDITRGAIAKGFDRQLTRNERQFLYMPLMHSEDIPDQRLSLRLFTRLGRGFGMPFARSHYRAVARFGRFPHRNDVLGRSSTAAEEKAVANGMKW